MAGAKKDLLELEREMDQYRKVILGLIGLIQQSEAEDEDISENFRLIKAEFQHMRPDFDGVAKRMDHVKQEIYRREIEKGTQSSESQPIELAEQEEEEEESHEEIRKQYEDMSKELLLRVCSQLSHLSKKEIKERAHGLFQDIAENFSFDNYYDYITQVRELIELLETHISKENLEVNNLLQEILNQLSETEKVLFRWLLENQENLQNREMAFTGEMGKNIKAMEESLSGDLESVKENLLSRLAAIRQALDVKKQADDAQMVKTANQMKTLEMQLQKTKKRFDVVEAYNKRVTAEAEQLKKRSLMDSLTKIYNRGAYEDYLATIVREGLEFALIVFDIDRFKEINDKFGHLVGDRILQKVVQIVRRQTRKEDFMARYGGDEFVIVLLNSSTDAAVKVAENIRLTMEQTPFRLHRKMKQLLKVRLSLGVAAGVKGALPEKTFKKADQSLYQAKRKGGNRVCV